MTRAASIHCGSSTVYVRGVVLGFDGEAGLDIWIGVPTRCGIG
jgi:hypothetical protein